MSYWVEDIRLLILNQRRLPLVAEWIACANGPAIAGALKLGLVSGGPLMGEIAADAVALEARLAAPGARANRAGRLRWTLHQLSQSSPASGYLAAAIARLAPIVEESRHDTDGAATALRLKEAADGVVETISSACRETRRHAREALADADRPLQIVTSGSTGPLSGGDGTGLTALAEVIAVGRRVHAWIAETRPRLEGARLGSTDATRLGIPHTVIPDNAAAALVATRDVDAVVVAAERVARNGDLVAITGTYDLAVVAARHGLPLLALAPSPTIDRAMADGRGFAERAIRQRHEVTIVEGNRTTPIGTSVWAPPVDVTPAELITATISDDPGAPGRRDQAVLRHLRRER